MKNKWNKIRTQKGYINILTKGLAHFIFSYAIMKNILHIFVHHRSFSAFYCKYISIRPNYELFPFFMLIIFFLTISHQFLFYSLIVMIYHFECFKNLSLLLRTLCNKIQKTAKPNFKQAGNIKETSQTTVKLEIIDCRIGLQQ